MLEKLEISLDANSIENMWSYIKMKLGGKPVYMVKQLIYRIKKKWSSLPNAQIENIIKSMKKNKSTYNQ